MRELLGSGFELRCVLSAYPLSLRPWDIGNGILCVFKRLQILN